MDTETQHAPQDLLIEILLKLPVKSLLRFKGVCKFWRSLISDHVARLHFELGAHGHRLGLININHGIKTIDLDDLLNPNSISEAIMIDFSSNLAKILGSCRGFLLLGLGAGHEVWNPSTRERKSIPSSPSSHFYRGVYPLSGFGYDSSKDDYIVVQLFSRTQICLSSPHQSRRFVPHVEFFSLRANMWTDIEGSGLPRLDVSNDLSPGLLFNGALHWLVKNHDKSMNVVIVFDLMEKNLVEMPRPNVVTAPYDFSTCKLWVYGRFLSLSISSLKSNTIEVWIMEKYRVESSWNKTLVLSLSDHTVKHDLSVSALCSTESGDIILDNSHAVVKCNDKGNELEHRRYRGRVEFHVPMYTESIFSLPDVHVS